MSIPQVSKKSMKSNRVISVPYCDLQSALSYQEPFAYSAGTYGWSCDYYRIDNFIISTGYSPIGKEVDYNLIHKTEEKARLIISHRSWKQETKKRKIKELLLNLCKS